MKQESKGWVISNENHPSGIDKYLIGSTFARTRKRSIELFCEGSGYNWKYWYRKYNFRCVKATISISLNDIIKEKEAKEQITPDQIISGLTAALQKCDAINFKNVEALISLLNKQVKDDILEYGKQQINEYKEEENEIYQPIDILDTSNPPRKIEKLKLKEPEEIKTVNCYIAMNKDEYNIENMSFSQNKNKLVRRWGAFQDIIKAKIIFKTIIN